METQAGFEPATRCLEGSACGLRPYHVIVLSSNGIRLLHRIEARAEYNHLLWFMT